MHRPWLEMERGPRADDLAIGHRASGQCQLDLGATRLEVPGLILLVVKLKAERITGADEEDLADILIGLGPDLLPAPRLVDVLLLERESIQAFEIWLIEIRHIRAHIQVGGFRARPF